MTADTLEALIAKWRGRVTTKQAAEIYEACADELAALVRPGGVEISPSMQGLLYAILADASAYQWHAAIEKTLARQPARGAVEPSARWACLACSTAAGVVDDPTRHISHAFGEPCPRVEPPAQEPLDWLRAIIVGYRDATRPVTDNPKERAEVETIQKTLNVVLARIDEVRSARSTSPPERPQEWQPIETAPKDRTFFIALDVKGGVRKMHWCERFEPHGWADADGFYVPEAVGWIPLPSVPHGAAKESA